MSVYISGEAWQSTASGSDLVVLLALADHADTQTRECFPSLKYLARKCKMSQSTVQRSVKSLAEAGLITVMESGRYEGKSNRYRVHPLGRVGQDDLPPQNEQGDGHSHDQGDGHSCDHLTVMNHQEPTPTQDGLLDDELSQVMGVLTSVAQFCAAPVPHHTTVASIIKDFPDRDALDVAKKLRVWVQDGGKVKRVGLTFRNWMERERPKQPTPEAQSPQDIRAALTRLRNVGRRA